MAGRHQFSVERRQGRYRHDLTRDKLDVNGTIRFGYGGETCDAAHVGAMYYSSATHLLYGCLTAGAWTAISTGSTAGAAAGSDRQVQFNSGGALAGSANLVFTSAGRLGIGTASPGQQLQITAAMSMPATTSSTTGVIYKGANSFIHDFAPAGSTGHNTFMGVSAGNFTMTWSTGNQSSFNTGVGYSALNANTTGYLNTALGYDALKSNTSYYQNTAIGAMALYSDTTGYSNTAVGSYAAYSDNGGINGVAVGDYALYSNTTGRYNIAIGFDALYSDVQGFYNTAVGDEAGYHLADAWSVGNNSFFGSFSGNWLQPESTIPSSEPM